MKELIEQLTAEMRTGLDKVAGLDESFHDEFMEKFAEELDALVDASEGIDKEAGMFGGPSFAQGLGASLQPGAVGSHMGDAMKTGAAGAMLALGGIAAKKALKGLGNIGARTKYEAALAKAIQMSPMLKDADQDKIRRFGDSIYSFAPHVSQDSNVLANILANAIHGESLDLQTIRAITELEEKFTKARGM